MSGIPPRFLNRLKQAMINRKHFFTRCSEEKTDCYRLFHGAVEQWPSVTIDRYGSILLFQTWRDPLTESIVAQMADHIETILNEQMYVLWCDRRKRGQVVRHVVGSAVPQRVIGMELGIRYTVDPIHKGIDPLLFLDFRAGRRKILRESSDQTVLNLFSYTCGIGVAAAKGGAKRVVNVDFSTQALNIGQQNAVLNGVGKEFQVLQEDAIAVMRQFSGLGIKGRARRRSYIKLSSQVFDIVVLDPPRRAKSPFGLVDTVNDYQSLFKPALLCTKSGGQMLVTNNVASVSEAEWVDKLHRCANKNGRTIDCVEILSPEQDFPSLDGKHPLKMAWLTVS